MLMLSVEQMRVAEQLANARGISDRRMMESAGRGVARFIIQKYQQPAGAAVILAGTGNNGGDGFVTAMALADAGSSVIVILCGGKPKSPTASYFYEKMLKTRGVKLVDAQTDINSAVHAVRDAALIIDAIYGTGFNGNPDAVTTLLIDTANLTPAVRIAIDIPTGVYANNGHLAAIYFMAQDTLALAALKHAHTMQHIAHVLGIVEVIDIGIPEAIIYASVNGRADIRDRSVARWIEPRRFDTHKGDYGRTLIIAGSEGMMGAAMMPTLAAVRSGSGLTTLAAPRSLVRLAAPQMMEAMTIGLPETEEGTISAAAIEKLALILDDYDVVAAGCGMRTSEDTKQIVEFLIRNTKGILILDADALNSIAEDPVILRMAKGKVIVTPHIGELARMTKRSKADILTDTEHAAMAFTKEYGCTTVLKSHQTVTTSPDGFTWINRSGNAGLAKGGSGDVLTGMIAAFAAQGMEYVSAAICAVWTHGFAADCLAERMALSGIMARDVINEIPAALKRLDF